MTIRMVASKAAADGLVTSGEPPPPSAQRAAPGIAEPAFAANPYAGVGRNDPCPCGSGKKFKKCHERWFSKKNEGHEAPCPSFDTARCYRAVNTEFPDASAAIAKRATLRPRACPESMSNR